MKAGFSALALLATLITAAPAAAQSFPPQTLKVGTPGLPGADDRGVLPVPYARYVPDEVLVRFREGVGSAQRSAALAAVGAKLDRVLPVPGLRTVKLPGGTSVDEAVRRFEANPRVLYAEPNHRFANNSVPNDLQATQWGLHNTGLSLKGFQGGFDRDIDAPEAWDLENGSTNVVVGHIDGGVARSHPDLQSNLWTNSAESPNNGIDDDGNGYVDDWRGWDWTSHSGTSAGNCAAGDNDPEDNNGHGTHTAGTIGARGNNGTGLTGVAQRVAIMPLRVTDRLGGVGDLDDMVCAFRYAANKGAKIVNASVGGPFTSQALLEAVSGAPNTLLVTTAGNDAVDVDVNNWWPCNLPATNVLCVGATDANDNLWLDSASFWAARNGAGSNYGDTNVDMAAPGMFVQSTSPFRSIFRDDFEYSFYQWQKGGNANNDFGAEYPTSGPQDGLALTDSPNAQYDNAVREPDAWAQAPGRNTLGMRDCRVDFRLVHIDMEKGILDPDGSGPGTDTIYDYLAMDLSTGGGVWTENVGRYWRPKSDPGTRAFALGPEYDNKGEFWLRYRFHSDGSVQGDGAHVDDLDVRCVPDNRIYDTTSYGWDSGTSMAAPHVAGVAALMLAAKPGLAPYELKQILMDSGDYLSSLDGKTYSGRRLNAANAVASVLPPDTTITQKPANPTGDTSAQFKFTSTQSTSEPSAGFECRVDGATAFWHDCTPGATYTYQNLAGGTYTFYVRAINRAGVEDPSPATYTWTVDKTGPNTFLDTNRPADPTGYTNARFAFTASEGSVTYDCKLDSGAWETGCTSPKAYPAAASGAPLSPGTHTFQVLARDRFGNPDPSPASYTWTIAPPAAERHPAIDGWSAGASVRGDFDGDGFDDLAVGVPGEDVGAVTDAGAVHVVYGATGGLNGARSWYVTQDSPYVLDAAEPDDRFGASLAVGDFNGDGKSDLAVGTPAEDGAAADTGTVHVFPGSPTGLKAVGSRQWTQATAVSNQPAEVSDQFGATLAAGDTTGDGRAELLVGAPGEDLPGATDAGAVHLLPGGASGVAGGASGKLITQATQYVTEDAGNGDQLGGALALGDFNDDGKADLALAAPGEQVGTVTGAGAVHVLAGAAGGYTTAGSKLFHEDTPYVLDTAESGDHFGAALAAGDFGGSSADELAIGVPDEDRAAGMADSGAVHVLMGSNPGLLTTSKTKLWMEDTPYVVDESTAGDRFGAALAAGNLTGGGQHELAIGIPGEDVGFAPDAGAVNVLAGSTNGLVTIGNRIWTQATAYIGENAEPGDHFGAALAAGDFGDSAEDDLIVGVPDESQGAAETRDAIAAAGAVQRIPGTSTGLRALDSQTLTQASYGVADAPEAGDGFGAALGR